MRISIPRPRTAINQFFTALRGTFRTVFMVLAGVLLTAAIFTAFVLTTFPQYTWQLLSTDIGYTLEAVTTLVFNLYASTGVIGMGLSLLYSALTAAVILHVVTQLRFHGLRSSVAGAGGAAPVFLIGGCAGCGAGLLGLVGAAGAFALFPFNGNAVRLLGVLFLAGFLSYSGDPRTCTVT
ncbi:MAG: hypothetical protein SVY41_00865 [Candidatus Nanohaloarchaea archaeon]|nr:hypothetical protein [Candidatus Nanohaloarchaea archaeon]